jgi:hypothetical protein
MALEICRNKGDIPDPASAWWAQKDSNLGPAD